MSCWKHVNEREKIVSDNGSIGGRILSRRKALKISQHALAKLVRVSNSTISLWESDKTAPKGQNLHNLAMSMQCPAEWILYGETTLLSPPQSSASNHLSLTDDELEILSLYQSLPSSEQKSLIQSLRLKSQYFNELFQELKIANKRISKK